MTKQGNASHFAHYVTFFVSEGGHKASLSLIRSSSFSSSILKVRAVSIEFTVAYRLQLSLLVKSALLYKSKN
ncbi:hypothetical protein [Cellvibrio sp.]|uniref:hypothetical protein n=1 Tax=Cellvibrio sp. TaxID=1965322 RepID=UPI003964816F